MPRAVTVYAVVPSESRPTEYVPGISPHGTAVPPAEAKRLLAAGLVTTEPPTRPDPPEGGSFDTEDP